MDVNTIYTVVFCISVWVAIGVKHGIKANKGS